jgi:hypothetical protein
MQRSTVIWLLSLNPVPLLFPPKKYPLMHIQVLGRTRWDPPLTIQKLIMLRWDIPTPISNRARLKERSSSQIRREKTTYQARKTQVQGNMTSKTQETKRISMLRVSMLSSCRRFRTARTQKLRTLRILDLVCMRRNSVQLMQALSWVTTSVPTLTHVSTTPTWMPVAW